jgi:hypothetical protein
MSRWLSTMWYGGYDLKKCKVGNAHKANQRSQVSPRRGMKALRGAIPGCGKGYSYCVAVLRGERKLLIATSFLGNTLDRISRMIPMNHIAGLEMVQSAASRLTILALQSARRAEDRSSPHLSSSSTTSIPHCTLSGRYPLPYSTCRQPFQTVLRAPWHLDLRAAQVA